ncbi:MAG: hypothetical protein LBQ75_05685 [Zoogloeaceae bacterium]|nr:hypothetical protein [Zoogloeaceae bacterium]
MGNHTVGKAIGQLAEEAVRGRKPGEAALDILDRICKRWGNCDAAFDSVDPDNPSSYHPDYDDTRIPHPKAALGMLLVEAFAPNGLDDLHKYQYFAVCDSRSADYDEAKDTEALETWAAEIEAPFKKRYNFW